jgi:dephospho-CoA kinase
LEAIIHPFVYEALDEWIKEHQDEKFVFADIPLLYETNREKCFDEVIVITVPLEINVQRLMARDGIDEQYAMQKIHSQMPLEEKAVKGNYVIDNAGSIVDTAHQLNKILQKIRR